MSLKDFAEKDRVRTGYTPWRELNDDNAKAWEEAVEGYKSGIAASVVSRWLRKDKGCPLTDSTIRKGLIASINE